MGDVDVAKVCEKCPRAMTWDDEALLLSTTRRGEVNTMSADFESSAARGAAGGDCGVSKRSSSPNCRRGQAQSWLLTSRNGCPHLLPRLLLLLLLLYHNHFWAISAAALCLRDHRCETKDSQNPLHRNLSATVVSQEQASAASALEC